ncbi:GNAT family N-acetyltransferase [Novosphingobium sp. M1R2S20]|uniref:GNAT family N-acetyltransferase n=1 Tax=Novosphingobium rhizovicinum TaxID=3228928 RepID=A0ABV3RDB5_9SPHN
MFIRTERLFLRPGWPEDFEDLVEVLDDDAVGRSIGALSLPRTPAEVRAYLKRPRDVRLPQCLINLRGESGPRVIGSIGLVPAGEEVELGCWIIRGYQGHGYAAEAVRAVLSQARTLGYSKVIARDFSESGASARVLLQSGFEPAGEMGSRMRLARQSGKHAKRYVAVLADKFADWVGARGVSHA